MTTVEMIKTDGEKIAEALSSISLGPEMQDMAEVGGRLADGTNNIARSIERLGNNDASTPMGAIEGLAKFSWTEPLRLRTSSAIVVAPPTRWKTTPMLSNNWLQQFGKGLRNWLKAISQVKSLTEGSSDDH